MPRKIRQLKADLRRAGFVLDANRGKGSHAFWIHRESDVKVTLSGHDGDDAKVYQEKEVRSAIAAVKTTDRG
jgi:predicted RNA binding protein YcfA (HicA-like mRNA interferase family)